MQGGRKVACFTLVWNVRRRRIGPWCVPAMRDPRVARQEDEHFYYPRMIGGNSLFGETERMRAVGFDEQIAFVMEDVDFTYRWTCTQ